MKAIISTSKKRAAHILACEIFLIYVENTQLDDIIIKIIPENANIVYFKLITIQVRLLPHRHPDL